MIHDADFDLGRRLWCFSTSFGQGGFSIATSSQPDKFAEN
jgi:hypothetical protein